MKISLYIHIPFCVRKCLYCDFLSFYADKEMHNAYVKALCNEIVLKAPLYKDYEVTTIFLGGGTPSILSGELIGEIMDSIRENYILLDDCEVSMEINPGTDVSISKYIDAGINRVSIGLQSSNDDELKMLGRIHSRQQFEDLYYQLLSYNFNNINVDLISGLPNQDVEKYKRTLDYVLSLDKEPAHISAYSLIVEENTPFYNMELELPTENEERKMYSITSDILKNAGYNRYEISNYAKENMECRHNIVYWERGNYLGLGLGASSMVGNVRFKNTDNIDAYINGDYQRYEEKILSQTEQMEEYMFLGLRMMKGVSQSEFMNLFGSPFPKQYLDVIDKYIKMDMLYKENGRIMLTDAGINVSNVILADFLI